MPALRNILVAVKPGSADAHPLERARALAKSAGARLTVLSVPPGAIPAIEIAREAESKGVDLIVLGRELPSQTDLRHDGNTVEGTVGRARVPCLLVPRGPHGLARVLAAVDGGPDSRDVMAAAALVGRVLDASVRAVHVEAAVLVGVGAPTGLHEVPAAVGDGTIVRQGDPVSEILRVAREDGVDLLVFGHHRGGPVSTHATSGVAARLLQRAPGAVLAVPI